MIADSPACRTVFQRHGNSARGGVAFATNDREGGEQVAIVSAELARRVYGSPAKAIGRPLVVGRSPTDGYTIVGVTADTKVRSLAESPRFMAYLPIGQSHVQEISAMIRGDVTTAASAAQPSARSTPISRS
jgi:hypothetical protein